ncbi:MAG: C25 family cysteine peptidase, partial [Acidobacteriota bacterium]
VSVVLANDPVDNTIYLNRVSLDYHRDFTAVGDGLLFQAAGPATYSVRGFNSSQITVLDITDKTAPLEISGAAVSHLGGGEFQVSFGEPLAGPRTYLVTDPGGRLSPAAVKTTLPMAGLSDPANGADWIAICPLDFQAALAPLVAHRASQGLRTFVVSPQAIYDQFNHGVLSPQAIKDFVATAFNTWTPPAPLYLLLVGDANLDSFDFLQFGGNFVPVFYQQMQGKFGLRLMASDHAYVAVAGADNLQDLAVGRLPARSAAGVTAMVDKIPAYETSPPQAALNRGILLVADDLDPAGPFDYAAVADERCLDLAPTGLSCLKTYRGLEPDAAATRAAIDTETNAGTLLLTYYGSANARQWGFDPFYDKPEIDLLANGGATPLVVSLGTQNGLFAAPSGPAGDPAQEGSMLERYVRRVGNGAVAAVGAAGGTILAHMDRFGAKLFDELFIQGDLLLGEAVRTAKNRAVTEDGVPDDSLRMLNLLGDPATPLALNEDLDGDGTSNTMDCAPHNAAVSALPGEVGPSVGFLDAAGQTMAWSPAAGAQSYNVYRGTRQGAQSWNWDQICIDIGNTVLQVNDPTAPAAPPQSLLFYLVTGSNICGEGTAGVVSSGAGRPPVTSCEAQDADGDLVLDVVDNCPLTANPDQADADADGIGDICDSCTDSDADGFGNPGFPANTCAVDNCPAVPNPAQANSDGDAFGDLCDHLRVNFGPAGVVPPPGFVADEGVTFDPMPGRGYGWNGSIPGAERMTAEPLERDTFLFTQVVRTWQAEVP